MNPFDADQSSFGVSVGKVLDSMYPEPEKGPIRKCGIPLYVATTVLILLGIVVLIIGCFIPTVPINFTGGGSDMWSSEFEDLCKNGCGIVNDAFIAKTYSKMRLSSSPPVNEVVARLSAPFTLASCNKFNLWNEYALTVDGTQPKGESSILYEVKCHLNKTKYSYISSYTASLSGYRRKYDNTAIEAALGEDIHLLDVRIFVIVMFVMYGISFLLQFSGMFVAIFRQPRVKTVSVEMCCGCDDSACCNPTYETGNYENGECLICTSAGNLHRVMIAAIISHVLGITDTIAYIIFCAIGRISHFDENDKQVYFTITPGYWAVLSIVFILELVSLALMCAIFALKMW